ncbi:MAG: dienelactone hydrolase family protein [Planctomycetota bacterium]
MLSGTDYSLPGPYHVGEETLVINRTAGDSGSFDAKIFYPAISSGSSTPLDASGGPYPVLSFAHGYLTDARAEYSETARHLASHGYLVVLPSSYESVLDVFEAESLGHDGASGFNYLVAQSSNPSSPYYLAVDTSGFAAMGHSMGGAASISEASQNASVKTIVTWAAQNMINPSAPDQIPNVHVPIQMIAGTEDAIVSSSTTSTIFNSASAPIVLNNLIGGFHFGFEDYGDGIGADSGPMPRATQLGYARSLSVQWLNLYMKGDQSAWRQLWGPEATTDPQIQNSRRSGIAVTTPNNQQWGSSGSIIDYTITVQNTGTYATSYSLLAEGSWNTMFSALQTPVIGPGGFATVHAFVTVPTDTPIGTVGTVLVSARNDTDGGTRAFAQLQSTVTNSPPVANAGGPYAVTEGVSLTLDATATFDPNLSDVLSFSWDVNGDGTFGDATGVSPTLDWTTLVSLGISDGPTSWNVRVRVDDGAGNIVTSSSAILLLNNGAPSVSVDGPTSVAVGQSAAFDFTAIDPSPLDQAGSFLFIIDWNGDGWGDDFLPGTANLTVNHTFMQAGPNQVKVTVTDKDGGVSAVTTYVVNVSGVSLAWTGSTNELIVAGTEGDDVYKLEQINPTTVRLHTLVLDGVAVGTSEIYFGVGAGVLAYGFGGNDSIVATALTNSAVTVYGGAGNDTLRGGSASDEIFGEEDIDHLFGGLGNDWVEGGEGADVLYGEWENPGNGTAFGIDTLHGGEGNDTIYGDGDGGEGTGDLIYGDAGDDLIYGDGNVGKKTAVDTIHGGLGNDTIYGDSDGGEAASDLIYGDEDNDTIFADGSKGSKTANDTVYGGSGDDIIDGDGGEGGADSLWGDAGNDIIDTGKGSDYADGGEDSDLILGGDGGEGADDNLIGSGGNDMLVAGVGSDSLDSGAGEDLLIVANYLPASANSAASIFSEWSSTRPFAERVANIQGVGVGPRNNTDDFLVAGDTVVDDNAIDTVLAGGSEEDWAFIKVTQDVTSDIGIEDIVTVL